MGIIKLTLLRDYPKILPIPLGNNIRIYNSDENYLVEFLPNNESKPRILCPPGMIVDFDETYIIPNKEQWIKIINENENPLEITIEFYFRGSFYKHI